MQKVWFCRPSSKSGKVEGEILGLFGHYSIVSERASIGGSQEPGQSRRRYRCLVDDAGRVHIRPGAAISGRGSSDQCRPKGQSIAYRPCRGVVRGSAIGTRAATGGEASYGPSPKGGRRSELAAPLLWTEGATGGAGFVCLDQNLREAGLREGFTVLPKI